MLVFAACAVGTFSWWNAYLDHGGVAEVIRDRELFADLTVDLREAKIATLEGRPVACEPRRLDTLLHGPLRVDERYKLLVGDVVEDVAVDLVAELCILLDVYYQSCGAKAYLR